MFGTSLAIMGALLVLEAIRSHVQLMKAVQPRPLPAALASYPSVTVIRPIKGLDCEVAENIRVGLRTGYPGEVQTIFVFDDESEPALPLVHEAISAFRAEGRSDAVEILFCGQPPAGKTGKLNAMITGLAKARGELVAFADSDVRADDDVLRIMTETLLGTEGAGSAFPPVVVSEPHQTIGDVDVAIMLNALYTPMSSVMAAKNDGELPFILGQYMIFTRETLDQIVRLGDMQGQFVDDLHMGHLVKEAGLRNIVAPVSIRLIQYGYGLKLAFDTYCRWMTFSRSGMPDWSYKLPTAMRAIVYLLSLIGGSIALAQGAWAAAALNFGAALIVNHTMIAIHREIGGAPIPAKWYLVPGAYFILIPFIFVRIYMQRQIEWRGRKYSLNGDAMLDEVKPLSDLSGSGASPEAG